MNLLGVGITLRASYIKFGIRAVRFLPLTIFFLIPPLSTVLVNHKKKKKELAKPEKP